ncbi:HEAT repeat domain-containing protein [Streptomyces griseosporeus]|uniref:HEAT repeat domain-containing protein n=1 Tax=Streptomyces griseosporeus TaxID=1910 RepID=UPI0037009A84
MSLFSWLKRRQRPVGAEAAEAPETPERPEPPEAPEVAEAAADVRVRGAGAFGIGGDVVASAVGPHSTVTYIQQLVQRFEVTGADRAPLTPREVAEAIGAYAAQVRQRYGRLDLEVLIPSDEGDGHPAVQLREVFVPPLLRADPPPPDLPPELRKRLLLSGDLPADEELPPGVRREALERLRQAYLDRPPVPLLDVVTDPRCGRLVLLGDPGAGKSTLGRYLALGLTAETPPAELARLAGWLPVVVELRKYAEPQWRERTFEDFLDHLHRMESMSVPSEVLRRCLTDGRVLVVFDGLDEIFDPAVRDEVSRRIAGFAGRYDGARIIVTSRVIGYRGAVLDGAGFGHHMIQDLTREQIGEFARRWYGTVCGGEPAECERLSRRITAAVEHSRPVRELAGNPLLLTILAIIGRRQELPRDRQGVYDHAVRVLTARWDQEAKLLKPTAETEVLRHLDDEDRRELLRLLARRMQDGEGGIAGNRIHGTELEEVFKEYLREIWGLPLPEATVAAREMKRQFEERNFILSRFGGEVYGFVHRAFLEYLAAIDIAQRYAAREWTEDELIDQVFVRRADDPNWHEVLLLLVGLLERQISVGVAGRAVDALLGVEARSLSRRPGSIVLTVRALAEVRRIAVLERQSREVIDRLVQYLDRFGSTVFARLLTTALPALQTFPEHWRGRSRLLRWFHVRGQFLGQRRRAAASIACGLYGGPELPAVLARCAPEGQVRSAALGVLADRWADALGTRELVSERALTDQDAEVRIAALELLAKGWADAPDTHPRVRDAIAEDGDARVRAAALTTLARHWGDAPETPALVHRMLSQDGDERVRVEALRALTEHWPRDPCTTTACHVLAAGDSSGRLRAAALDSLAAGKAGSTETHALMWDRAVADPHWSARRIALQYLADRAGQDPRTYELLNERAVRDEDGAVRYTALRLLATHWADRDETRALLHDRAAADPESTARGSALELIAQHWPDDRSTLALLRSRAVDDGDDGQRAEALRLLVELAPEDADTLALVRDRILHDEDWYVVSVALAQLAERWSDHPDVVTMLKDFVVSTDRPADERAQALRHLAGHLWPGSLVHDLAVDDATDISVRSEALGLLAAHRTDEPGTYVVVRELCADGAFPAAAYGLTLLATHWPDAPGTLPTILDRAARDARAEVRAAALNRLTEHWSDTPDLPDLYRDRALHDPDPGIRTTALQRYAWETTTDEAALFVGGRLTDDVAAEVRIAAARILAFAWPGHPDTLRLLRERIDSDQSEDVREEAAHMLAAAEDLAPLQDKLP